MKGDTRPSLTSWLLAIPVLLFWILVFYGVGVIVVYAAQLLLWMFMTGWIFVGMIAIMVFIGLYGAAIWVQETRDYNKMYKAGKKKHDEGELL